MAGAKKMLSWVPKPTPEETIRARAGMKRKILQAFHRLARPTLIGEVSMRLNLHLDITSELMDEMVEEGVLRGPNPAELAQKGEEIRHRYLLVGPVSAVLAGDDR